MFTNTDSSFLDTNIFAHFDSPPVQTDLDWSTEDQFNAQMARLNALVDLAK